MTDLPVAQGDLEVSGHGTLFLLDPTSEKGYEWIANNMDEATPKWGDAAVVASMYIEGMVDRARADGLAVV